MWAKLIPQEPLNSYFEVIKTCLWVNLANFVLEVEDYPLVLRPLFIQLLDFFLEMLDVYTVLRFCLGSELVNLAHLPCDYDVVCKVLVRYRSTILVLCENA